jgi:hypothetical protein
MDNDEGPLRWVKLLTVLMFFFLHAPSIFAACRVIEYAELKDTSSNDLIKTYCRYKVVSDLEAQHLKRLRDVPSMAPQRVPRESLEGSIAEHSKSAMECLEMQDTIRSILRNRSESDELSCNEDGTVKEGQP